MVVLSERYITDRYLPDKAIDIMDEASSHMAMHSPLINEINTLSRELTRLNEQKSAIEFQENKTEEDYRRLAEVTTKIAQKSGRFDGLSAERDELWLDEASVAKVIENWTGIPATSISENEYQKDAVARIGAEKRIIGQDEAIGKIARAIRRSRAGVAYKKKPVSFIFAGSTGVGKTELVKVLAAYLFDSPESLIRLDMSGVYGKALGLANHRLASGLRRLRRRRTAHRKKIRRKPYSVVLFDEIEKAHPRRAQHPPFKSSTTAASPTRTAKPSILKTPC